MKEKNLQTLFGKWVKEQGWNKTFAFELKICKGKSLSFDSIRPHQIDSLLKAKHSFLYYKINDAPIFTGQKTRFTNPKPFDCVVLSGAEAYLVIWFYKKGQRKKAREMIWIDIDVLVQHMKSTDRKSITEKKAKEIGQVFSSVEDFLRI